jgi:hypothetical protein
MHCKKVARSITPSAQATSVGGTSRPSALAVMRQDARIRELEEELEQPRERLDAEPFALRPSGAILRSHVFASSWPH